MTLIDSAPRIDDAAKLLDSTDLPIEQEWCALCVPDVESSEDPDAGMPREVVSRSIELEALPADWLPEWGSAGEFEVTRLSCGHYLSRRL